MSEVDERRFGIAPRTFEVHEDRVYLTMAGLLERLHMSESTLRRDAALWALGTVVSPRKRLWKAEEVDALIASRRPQPKRTNVVDIRKAVRAKMHGLFKHRPL